MTMSSIPDYKTLLERNELTIAVYGLGYVGLTISSVWIRAGAKVYGVDLDIKRIESIRSLEACKFDKDVYNAISEGLKNESLELTVDGVYASKKSIVKIIAVPIPLSDRKPIFMFLNKAIEDISHGLKKDDLIVLESSAPPGTTSQILKPKLEALSKMKCEEDFLLGYSPERIYIGRGVRDIEENYPKIVAGIGPRSLEALARLYSLVCRKGVLKASSVDVAEFEKIAEGVYRDVNIALSNELALLASKLGIDFKEVITLANSQPYSHLHKSGIGVGGACIPVYPYYMMYVASRYDLRLDVINHARGLNESMPRKALEYILDIARNILKVDGCKISILGLAFRGNIDDTRNSPSIELIKLLRAELPSDRYPIYIHDPYVKTESELEALDNVHLSNDLNEVIKGASIIILATDHDTYKELSIDKLKDVSGMDIIAVFDGRMLLDIEDVKSARNIIYAGIGRPTIVNI